MYTTNYDMYSANYDIYNKNYTIFQELLFQYIHNDKESRLELLAGFIDTHSCIKRESFYEIIQTEQIPEILINSLNLIAKSLGFSTSISVFINYNKKMKILKIFGNNLNEIPCRVLSKHIKKKNRDTVYYHHVKFEIEYIGKSNFNGWQVDKNERFLLGNFIVTHNSRLKNGKDAASPRYIWTELEKISTIIYNPIDDPVLNNQFEDNMPIEPEYYAPIIPMILVNGSQGIGTGFSTKIPPYNPMDIINNLKYKIKGLEMQEMDPWWQGFEGTVAKVDDYNYEIYGLYQVKDNKLIITELPVGEATSDYKEFLEKLLEGDEVKKVVVTSTKAPVKGKKAPVKKPVVKKEKEDNSFLSYKENNTDEKIYFELTFEDGYLNSIKDIDKVYHLVKKYSINNMNLFDRNGTIKKYNTVLDIINEYYLVRLEFYEKRKAYQLDLLRIRQCWL